MVLCNVYSRYSIGQVVKTSDVPLVTKFDSFNIFHCVLDNDWIFLTFIGILKKFDIWYNIKCEYTL